MSYIETPEDIARQLQEARQQLRDFEENASARLLIERLAASSPWHAALLARRIFGALALLSAVAALGVITVAFAAPELATGLRSIEQHINIPLPVALGIAAASLFVAWLMATLAAISMGRECDLLPHESAEHQRLSEQAARLARQKAVLERIRGTPMGAQPRLGTPGFASPRRASGALAERGLVPENTASEPPIRRTPSPYEAREDDPLPSPRANGGSPLLQRARQSSSSAFMGASTLGGTPLGAPPRGGTPVGAPTPAPRPQPLPRSPGSLSYSNPADEMEPSFPGRTPVPQGWSEPPIPETRGYDLGWSDANEQSYGGYAEASYGGEASQGGYGQAAEASYGGYAEPEPAESSYGGWPEQSQEDTSEASYGGYAEQSYGDYAEHSYPGAPISGFEEDTPTQPGLAPPGSIEIPDIVDQSNVSYQSVGHGSSGSTDIPSWGRVDEPWLEDAIEKAEILAESFPVQAHMEFSVEPGLPFTLVLKRATPAMAVRAMVSYVEFLASIHTPPRARVVLQSVPHLDRSFHRNVMAALEPYFPDTADVQPHAGRVDIEFLAPDPGWEHYPYLPLAQ